MRRAQTRKPELCTLKTYLLATDCRCACTLLQPDVMQIGALQ